MLCDNLRGWGGKGSGGVQQEDTCAYDAIHSDVRQKLPQYCKAIISQIKNK